MSLITRDLWCELDDAEVQERALQMSSASISTDETEDEKKAANKHFAEKLGSLRSEIRRLSTIIRARREMRPVSCDMSFHVPTQGIKRITRLDTGEHVRDEPMSSFEAQDNLFEPKPDAAGEPETKLDASQPEGV